jgi:hypothetical protein
MICSFCGLGTPRRQRFVSGFAGYAICDQCIELMVSMRTGAFPPPGVELVPGQLRQLEDDDPERLTRRFAAIVCRFCGRTGPAAVNGGVAGSTPDAFICADCVERTAAELIAE